MAQKSRDLIKAMRRIAEDTFPITGRGVGYKLFTLGLIPSMATRHMKGVYRLLKIAREDGTIPWAWIVDETRELERTQSWRDPEAYVQTVRRAYRRDAWLDQPVNCEVWSEKGTIRGVLQPILREFGVGFRVMHGFGSATSIYDAAQEDGDKPLHVLYVGDWDPSGLYMSEHDLPDRLGKYGGDHISLDRVGLLPEDLDSLPGFAAKSKAKDSRYQWFVRHYGQKCWELDAMDPNDLRERVVLAILRHIEPDAWERSVRAQEAEQESLEAVLSRWLPT